MHPGKAPCPYGYNALFFQKNWNVIGAKVTQAVQSFFTSGKLLKEINLTFVTLMPKSATTSSLQLHLFQIIDLFHAAMFSTS